MFLIVTPPCFDPLRGLVEGHDPVDAKTFIANAAIAAVPTPLRAFQQYRSRSANIGHAAKI
jgi:hypothetical protein